MHDENDPRIQELCTSASELRHEISELDREVEPESEVSERLRRARVLVEQAIATLEHGLEPVSVPPMSRLRARLTQVVDRLVGGARSEPWESVTDDDYDDYADEAEGSDAGGISGTSDSVTIPDLLGFLQVQGKTGRLEIELAEERISLHVSRGDLVAARSDHSPVGSRLGEILVSRGVLERATLGTFVVFHAGGSKPIGQVLELHELVTKEQLHDALVEQTYRLFQRLMIAGSARFVFHEGLEEPSDSDYRLSVVELLLESARQFDELTNRLEQPPPALPAASPKSTTERPQPL